MKKTWFIFLILLINVSLFALSVPQVITFQGRLTSSGSPVTGTKNMRFAIVDNSGNVKWQSHASNSVTVTVANGVYTVKLGDNSVSNMAPLNLADLDKQMTLNVRVWVEGEQLSPDIYLSSVPYALIARQAETVTKNSTAGNSLGQALGQATQPVLMPKLTNTQMNAISSPVNGSIIFNTTDSQLYWYDGTYWLPVGGTSANVSYDTGWVDCSTWTNQHLGTTAGGDLVHNLNASLKDLIIKVLISTDGTDTNSFEIANISNTTTGAQNGWNAFYIDANTLRIQTGGNGLAYQPDSGAAMVAITNQSWKYRIIVCKIKTIIKGANGSDYVKKSGDTMTGQLNVSATVNVTSGKIAESGNPLVPAGVIQMYGGSTAPGGWFICDGSAVSRTTYAKLYAAIGTTYGTGDGSTTFNLPDFRGVFPRGAGTSGKLTNANGVAFSGTLGTYQNDKMQGHWHDIQGANGTDHLLTSSYATGETANGNAGGFAAAQNANRVETTSPVTDETNGTPRTGAETNPANLAVNFIIKY